MMPTDDELGGVLSAYAMGRMRKIEAVARLRELLAKTATLPIAPGKELFRATIGRGSVSFRITYRSEVELAPGDQIVVEEVTPWAPGEE